jgi:MFS family permease
MLWGRLVVNIGNALGTGLLLFFLLYGLHRDPAGAQDELLLLIVVYTVFVVVASVVAGAISDRTGRRRGMTVAAASCRALPLCCSRRSRPSIALVAAALLGVGYGAYMAVGLALGTDLLPFPEDSARDLGFVTVAASLGQLLGRSSAPASSPPSGVLAAVPRRRRAVGARRTHDPDGAG